MRVSVHKYTYIHTNIYACEVNSLGINPCQSLSVSSGSLCIQHIRYDIEFFKVDTMPCIFYLPTHLLIDGDDDDEDDDDDKSIKKREKLTITVTTIVSGH